jgi:hypothetical protein
LKRDYDSNQEQIEIALMNKTVINGLSKFPESTKAANQWKQTHCNIQQKEVVELLS